MRSYLRQHYIIIINTRNIISHSPSNFYVVLLGESHLLGYAVNVVRISVLQIEPRTKAEAEKEGTK